MLKIVGGPAVFFGFREREARRNPWHHREEINDRKDLIYEL